MDDEEPVGSLEEATAWLAGAERVVVLTGAGISTESGISDFRGPQGLWTRDPAAERRATIDHWRDDAAYRRETWQRRLTDPPYQGQPNAGHLALADLDRTGRLHILATQNVDGLHLAAGVEPTRIVELHGNVRETMCLSCGDRRPMAEAIDRVRAGEADPPCRVCGGILKSASVSFGQALFPGDMERAQRAAIQADVFLAAGSTLGVHPAASLVPLAKRSGALLVIANDAETPYDGIADAVLRGRLGTVLPALVSGARPVPSRPSRLPES
ncbi:MAG TPA: Sir2 family NAD-dependent protein deacetylase [Acidimicrobiales bacterium]